MEVAKNWEGEGVDAGRDGETSVGGGAREGVGGVANSLEGKW